MRPSVADVTRRALMAGASLALAQTMSVGVATAAVDIGQGPGSGGSGSSGSSGSGSSGSDSSGSDSSGSDSSGSGSGGSGSVSWDSSGSGSWGSDSSGSGSGDTLSDSDSSNSGSDSSNSDSDSSSSGSGSSGSGSGSSEDGAGSSGGHDGWSGEAHGWGNLAARERPEFDDRGFPARRGEIISIDLTEAQLDAVKARGFKSLGKIKLNAVGMLVVRLRPPSGMTAPAALKLLQAMTPGTEYDLDHFFGVTSGGIDKSAAGNMLDMKITKSKPLWIGMIDTAVWTGATLRGVRVDAGNFAARTVAGRPPFAHGTAVASILVRHGAARLTAANIFTADRRPYSSAEAIARAVNWMVARKVPVINISIAGPHNALVDRVIAAAVARGHIVVAAAGNGGPVAPPAYPAASPGAIAVTAIDRAGRVYASANRGSYISMAAFGVAIGAEAPDGTLQPHSGTSFAAPLVSAHLAACVKHMAPGACVTKMEGKARDLGTPGRDPIYGYGLLVP